MARGGDLARMESPRWSIRGDEGVGLQVLEGGIRFEAGERHEDMLGDLEETVSLRNAIFAGSHVDFGCDRFSRIQEVDLAVGIGGRHFASTKTRDHWDHHMGSL